MTAILETVFQTYRGLQSYSDSGTVTVEIESIGKKFSGEKKLLIGSIFATNFMRNALGSSAKEPHLFRYQFTSTGHFAELKEDNLNFICSNHEGVFVEMADPPSSSALARLRRFFSRTGSSSADGVSTKQQLAKMGLAVALSYGWVSNLSYCVSVSLAWYIFSKRVSVSACSCCCCCVCLGTA